MRFFLLWLVFSFVSCQHDLGTNQPPTPNENIKNCLVTTSPSRISSKEGQILHPIVMVSNKPGNNESSGSGTIIKCEELDGDPLTLESFILTNYHVIIGAMDYEIVLDNPDEFGKVIVTIFNWDNGLIIGSETTTGMVVSFDKDADLALIGIRTTFVLPTATLAVKEEFDGLRRFDEVISAGCPFGRNPIHSVGEISDLKAIIDDESFVMSTASIRFGNSGGGLFHEFKGRWKLIGVPSKIYNGYGVPVWDMSFAIPAPSFISFLKSSNAGKIALNNEIYENPPINTDVWSKRIGEDDGFEILRKIWDLGIRFNDN